MFGYNARWGYYLDRATNPYLCGHRYYDPAAGRWLTRDPIGFAGGINLYGYCGGSGVGRVDVKGLELPANEGYGGGGYGGNAGEEAAYFGANGGGGLGGGPSWNPEFEPPVYQGPPTGPDTPYPDYGGQDLNGRFSRDNGPNNPPGRPVTFLPGGNGNVNQLQRTGPLRGSYFGPRGLPQEGFSLPPSQQMQAPWDCGFKLPTDGYLSTAGPAYGLPGGNLQYYVGGGVAGNPENIGAITNTSVVSIRNLP